MAAPSNTPTTTDMAWHVEKGTNDIVIDGVENGIASSPHTGLGDVKNLNISTFQGEASVNYNRVSEVPKVTLGQIAGVSTNSIEYKYQLSGQPKLKTGSIISVTDSGISGLSGIYWVLGITNDAGGVQTIQLTTTYNGSLATGFGSSGTDTISTPFTGEQWVGKAEEYISSSGIYRYFMMGIAGHLWVSDPGVYSGNWTVVNSSGLGTPTTGMQVTQGMVFAFCNAAGGNYGIDWQFTNQLGGSWNNTGVIFNTPSGGLQAHYAIRTPLNNGAIYYTDNSFVGSIEQGDAQQSGGLINQFTLGLVTANNTTNVVLTTLYQGDYPVTGLPVTFYPSTPGGSLPSYTGSGGGDLTEGTIYYLLSVTATNFQIATTSGGSAITVSGSTFFMTTFYPADGLWTINTKLISLPYYEVTTCLEYASSGSSTIGIGTIGRNFYTWDTTTNTIAAPSIVLALPESGIHRVLNVDNIFYIFAGNKGNIYLSNGGQLASVLSVPDYTANPYGTNQDPWFKWGDVMFLRGRVWFSIEDDHATNTTGNCGGVWSFTPTQNISIGQDIGIALRLENQNSYGTYNGICDVLLPIENQQANGPQYYSGWSNDYSIDLTGIDTSGTTPYTGGQAIIDTDLIPIGFFLRKQTLENMEYKLSRPLAAGESIEIQQRKDLSCQFKAIGPGPGGDGIDNTAGDYSYAFPVNFEKNQWIQFRIILTSTTTTPSYTPFVELRLHLV